MRHIEEAEQAALVEWAAYVSILDDDRKPVQLCELIIAIPNGAHLAGDDKQRGMQMGRLIAMGVKPGAADLFVPLARGEWHGLFVELKKPRKAFKYPSDLARAVSPAQEAFGELVGRFRFKHAVCYGFDEARNVIERYIDGRDLVLAEGAP